jgi:hypothetical protein
MDRRLLLGVIVLAALLLVAYLAKSGAQPAPVAPAISVVGYEAQAPGEYWSQDPDKAYTCNDAGSLLTDYCVLATPAAAEAYCTGDSGCQGYLTYPSELSAVTKVPATAVQLTATLPTSASSYGTVTFYKKTVTPS